MKNGSGPGPAATVTVPIRDVAPQPPAAAGRAWQRRTFAMRPSSPCGNETSTLPSSASESPRVKRVMSGELLPASGFVVPATKPGSKPPGTHGPPLPSPLIVNESVVSAAGSEVFHDVKRAVVVFVPHVGGVTSAARGPPSKCSFSVENGSCGLSSNVAVS